MSKVARLDVISSGARRRWTLDEKHRIVAESYAAPAGYNDTADHIENFLYAIETREHVVEDEVFGNNAAIACHMANHSYFKRTVATWDEATKTIKG